MTLRTSKQLPLKRKGGKLHISSQRGDLIFNSEASMIFQNLPLAEIARYPSLPPNPTCIEPTNLGGHMTFKNEDYFPSFLKQEHGQLTKFCPVLCQQKGPVEASQNLSESSHQHFASSSFLLLECGLAGRSPSSCMITWEWTVGTVEHESI